MIYTCYEMIRDCRAGRAEGWRYLVCNYVPVIRKTLVHYGNATSGTDAAVEQVLRALRLPGSNLFELMEPAPERSFVAELRQQILAGMDAAGGAVGIELEALGTALESLTLVEKQAVWLETMRYPPAETGVLLRMDSATVEKIRGRAAGLIRGAVDSWSQTILVDNGRALALEAVAAQGPECLPAKPFLDLLDGRTSWSGREQLERHVTRCWNCIDYFCRLVEVTELLRGNQPLSEAEAAPFLNALGFQPEPRSAWKRWFGGAGS